MDSVAITGQMYLYKVHNFFQFTHIVYASKFMWNIIEKNITPCLLFNSLLSVRFRISYFGSLPINILHVSVVCIFNKHNPESTDFLRSLRLG